MAWTTPRTWVASEVPDDTIMNAHLRDNFNRLVHVLAYKTADESVNNSTTVQDDDHLSLVVGASEMWYVNIGLAVSGVAGGGDVRFALTWPTGSSAAFTTYSDDETGALTIRSINTSGNEMNFDTQTAENFYDIFGILRVGGTSGTLQARWAAVSAVAFDTTIAKGSYMAGCKLA